MIESQLPELADGGYWYVVEAVEDAHLGGLTVGGSGWTAEYATISGVTYAVIRSIEVISAPTLDVSLSDALSSAGIFSKHYGRIEGR